MSKFIVTEYGNKYEVLKYPSHFVAVAVTVDKTGVETINGKKIVPAGTIVGGGVLLDDTKKVSKVSGESIGDAEGVLLNDVDVTHGDAPGAMLIHGFVNVNKLPDELDEDVIPVLPQITFLE